MKKMANGKSGNSSTESLEKNKRGSWDYVSDKLKEWSMKPTSYILSEFYTSLDIPRETFYRNLKTNEKLKEAHAFAIERIAYNREMLCIERNLTVNHVTAFMLPRHSAEWKEELEYRAELKAKHTPQGQISGNFTIVQEPIIETKEVDKQLKKKVKDA